MKEQLIFPSESNEKASLLKYDEHFERRKNKSMTLIQNSGFKIQRIRPSSPRIKRRHQSHKILIKHEEEKEQKNIENIINIKNEEDIMNNKNEIDKFKKRYYSVGDYKAKSFKRKFEQTTFFNSKFSSFFFLIFISNSSVVI